MGGAVGGGFTQIESGKTLGQSEGFGNETPWAEFNIYGIYQLLPYVLSDNLTPTYYQSIPKPHIRSSQMPL